MVVEGGAGADVDAGRHVRLHVVVELWQQVVAAVVLVAVEHDGAQRVRPRDLRAEGRAWGAVSAAGGQRVEGWRGATNGNDQSAAQNGQNVAHRLGSEK